MVKNTDANKDLWTGAHGVVENDKKNEHDVLENIPPEILGMGALIKNLFLNIIIKTTIILL